jgi:hypothetical protein
VSPVWLFQQHGKGEGGGGADPEGIYNFHFILKTVIKFMLKYKCNKTMLAIAFIQGVPRVKVTTSGECSVC